MKVHTKGMPLKIDGMKADKTTDRIEKTKKKNNVAGKMSGDEPVQEDDLEEEAKEEIKTDGKREAFLLDLTKKTDGYVGSDIESVCREAAIFALRESMDAKEITLKHFEKAMQKVPPSVDKEVEKSYEDLKGELSAARAKQMKEEKPTYMG